MGDDKFRAIQHNFQESIKRVDMLYTLECAKHGMSPQEATQRGMRTLIMVALANGWARATTTATLSNEPFNAESLYTKAEFLKVCGEAYDEVYEGSVALANDINKSFAIFDAKVASAH